MVVADMHWKHRASQKSTLAQASQAQWRWQKPCSMPCSGPLLRSCNDNTTNTTGIQTPSKKPRRQPTQCTLFWRPSVFFVRLIPLSSLSIFATMAQDNSSVPIHRVATFRFKQNVTATEKADRTSAFLQLYAASPDLILAQPIGGRPLNTPLDLTKVSRDKIWDTGFTVVFKVRRDRNELWERQQLTM